MSDTQTVDAEIPGDLVTPIDVDEPIVAAAYLGQTAVFVVADGTAIMIRGDERKSVTLHPGASVLRAASDGARFVTGGEDGRVVRLDERGEITVIAETGGRWVDALAIGPSEAVAWSAGKTTHVRDGKGWQGTLDLGMTASGLDFAPKGFQLAIAHYGGATLWMPRVATKPKELVWKGSHLDVVWSPDARFIVTSMQENSLHGWRVADSANMRMSGYPGKTRSLSWSPDGKWLATSGANAAIAWPFQAKDGPMGKEPKEIALRPDRVSQVKYHPRLPMLAVGYHDGQIMIARLNDKAELLARRAAPENGAVTALGWSRDGASLVFGTENGSAGIFSVPTT